MANSDFAVEWDNPGDGELTWRKEAGPETPLTQSREFYWYQGWARAAKERGAWGTAWRRIYVNGYSYGAREPLDLGSPESRALPNVRLSAARLDCGGRSGCPISRNIGDVFARPTWER